MATRNDRRRKRWSGPRERCPLRPKGLYPRMRVSPAAVRAARAAWPFDSAERDGAIEHTTGIIQRQKMIVELDDNGSSMDGHPSRVCRDGSPEL